jgi:hypothetical protein
MARAADSQPAPRPWRGSGVGSEGDVARKPRCASDADYPGERSFNG